MKVTGIAKGSYLRKSKVITLYPATEDCAVYEKFFDSKERRQKKAGIELYFETTFELVGKERTRKQDKTLFALIGIIFYSLNRRWPSSEEKYELYEELLYMYADRKKNRFTGELQPVRLSKSDTVQAARLIQGALDIIIEQCQLEPDQEADVKALINDWTLWRGDLEFDPLDYKDDEFKVPVTEKEWYELHKISEASGRGPIEKCHIISRGADTIEEPWNWMALTHQEHIGVMHQGGWTTLMARYPRLKGKVERARELAGKRSFNGTNII